MKCVCVRECVWYCIGLWKNSRAQKSGRIYTGESVIFKHDYQKNFH